MSFTGSRSKYVSLIAALLGVMAMVAVFLYRGGVSPPASSRQTVKPLPGGIRTPVSQPVGGPRLAQANVVIITVDTLRPDHLEPYGASFATPAATRLAREGVVFERAVSHAPLTLPSHTSLFTGLYPPQHAVRDNGGFQVDGDLTTLAERFEDAGYDTAGFVSAYVLHSRWGIAQGHQTYDDLFEFAGIENRALLDVERPAGPVVDAAVKWLRQPRRGARPFYLWVHAFDPHWPYEPPDDHRRNAPTPYAGEVMYADSQIARLLDALDELGLRKNTVVVYLSDHGESLGEHGEPTHGIFLYGASIDVPLIIAPPPGAALGSPAVRMAGRRVRGLARLVDVSPTILDLVGLPVPSADGTSLLRTLVGEIAAAGAAATDDPPDALIGPVSYAETYYPRFHYNWSELVAVETERWKFVQAPRPELYDLRQDSAERHDVSTRHPAIAATFAAHLRSLALEDRNEPAPAKLNPEERARLEALGYVGATESSAVRQTGPRPDPKDGLPLLRELLDAQMDRDAGRLEQARTRLESLVQRDAENPAVYVTLATVHDRRGDHDAAIRAGKRAVALDPESPTAVLNLAAIFKGAGELDAAATGFERVLRLDPENIKALLNLGEIHEAKGDREKAFEAYQRAVAAAPRLARGWISLGAAALELNRLSVAEEALKQAVAHGGKQPDLHFNLGVLAEQRGQKAVARREYQAEVRAYPDSLGAWVNLGLLEREMGRVEPALAAFERASSVKRDAMEGPYLMAETLMALGRREDADRWAQEALRRAPRDPRVGQLLEQMRRSASKKRR
jgi:choline-sulfatase